MADENNRGRPTKYKKEYDEQARKLCLLGYTDKELAFFFEVHEDTIYEWKKVHRSFSEALKNGKEFADANVAERLYCRASGYSHKETKVFCQEGKIIEHDVDKHYPPDTAAAYIWLKNRNPDKWRDKQPVKFDFEKEKSIKDQAAMIIEASTQGIISVTDATSLISAITGMVKIEEVTELKQRMDDIEEKLSVSSS